MKERFRVEDFPKLSKYSTERVSGPVPESASVEVAGKFTARSILVVASPAN